VIRDVPLLDLRGETFGRWTAIRRVGGFRWECVCECGTVRAVLQRGLRNGNSQSCGCARIKHGHSSKTGARSPTYQSWCAMITRCERPAASDYDRYGGRGISVCDRWRGREGFANFLADMGERPLGMTIDRIDNDGNYSPRNCRWATGLEQQRNRSISRLVLVDGEDITLEEASRRLGVAKTVIVARLAEHGDARRPHSSERLSRHKRAS
jgi:hypothetical protein